MDNPSARIAAFVQFVRAHLSGDEKGEAQVFCDRLFQAFGHPGIFEARRHPRVPRPQGQGHQVRRPPLAAAP